MRVIGTSKITKEMEKVSNIGHQIIQSMRANGKMANLMEEVVLFILKEVSMMVTG